MSAPDWLWAVFTVVAAAAQTLRNATQRDLTERIGTVGATQVRFLYGLPFACLFFLAVRAVEGAPPALTLSALGWTLVASVAQILATGLLLAAMRARSFVVVVTYSKTEPVQVALFGLVFLGDPLTLGLGAAVLAATAGVMLLSRPPAGAPSAAGDLHAAALGIASGAFFALAAIGFRGAIQALGADGFVLGATTILVIGLAIQSVLIAAYMLVRDPAGLRAVLAAWRPSLLAGLAGATASQFWFLAFALESAARVRTLALVEILFAQLVSMRLLREGVGGRELIGFALVAAGVALALGG